MGKIHINSSKGTKTEQELAHDLSNFVSINDVNVHFELSGDIDDETKPLIVLLHGFGSNTFSFRKVMEPLSNYGFVISYDRPAFGLTVRPKTWEGHNPYSYQAQVLLLDGIIKHFGGNRKVILLGHSAGAAIVAEWALDNQEQVSALILEAPAILTLPPSPKYMAGLMKQKFMDRLGPRLVGGFKKAGSEILYRSWYNDDGITQEVLDGYFLPLQVKGWEAGFWEFVRVGNKSVIQDHLGELNIPTLVIAGNPDQVIPTQDSIAVSKAIPAAELIIYEECGHIPHEENTAAFVDKVTNFISQL